MREHLDLTRYLKDLEYLINIDSGTGNLDGNRRAAEFFAERFVKAGFIIQTVPAGKRERPVVIAVSPVQEKSSPLEQQYDYYLGGHLDTVFPDGTAAKRPFRMENGLAYGPGAIDMKSGALLILYLAEALGKDHPEISLCIVLNSDEEIGSPDSAGLLRSWAAKCRRALIFEGGRKGGKLVNERKGIAKYKIEITGIASHAGTAPWDGASAILEAAHWVLGLDRLKDYDRGTVVNTGLIEGGTALNVVAPSAQLTVEIRYRDPAELAWAEREIHRMAETPKVSGTSSKVTRFSHYPPLLVTEKTRRWMEKLAPLGLEYVKAGGISDANRLADLELPILDGCGPLGGFPHSEKEYLRIETVEERFRLLQRILLQD